MGGVKPGWLRVEVSTDAWKALVRMEGIIRELSLHTVCQSAHCPNLPKCFGQGTATFLLLGDVCTRACRFCAVRTGWPSGVVDPKEPDRLAIAVERLALRYVVLTSVDRDDLPDGGASHFAACIRQIQSQVASSMSGGHSQDPREESQRSQVSSAKSPMPYGSRIADNGSPIIEALIPDFSGERAALAEVMAAGPAVVGHNLETVRRLAPAVRDRRASYDGSLSVLRTLKDLSPGLVTKSSLLLGLGEKPEEVEEALRDLRAALVDILMLGQYLRPSPEQLPVARYVPPEEFAHWKERARAMGFRAVVSGPLVRTSFRAAETFAALP